MTAPSGPTAALRPRRRARVADLADRAGAFVTLVAVVVLGLMIGSAVPGATESARPTLTVTFDR